jgi:hypothetical protein
MIRNTVARDEQRQPAAGEHLGQVGGEEGQLDPAEDDRGQHQLPRSPVPAAPGDDDEQRGVDQQRTGDRDPVRVASRSDDRNTTMRTSTPANSAQLTAGR